MNQTSNVFLKNILFLSSLAQFNTERIQLVLNFYHFCLKNKIIFTRITTLDDIQKFCDKTKSLARNQKSAKEALVQEAVMTLPGSVHSAWNLDYVVARYSHLDDSFLKEFGFRIGSLVMMEKVILETVYAKAGPFEILDKVYKFKSKAEYANLCFLKEPDITFQNKWNVCITPAEKELLGAYIRNWTYFDARYRRISQIKWKIDSEEELVKLRLTEAENILRSLSVELEKFQWQKPSHSFLKPLIRVHSQNDDETHYIVPFPYLLGSTTHFRIEDRIQNSPEIYKIDQSSKGKIVEFLAKEIFALLPNKNIIKSFKYKINDKGYESDLILFLNKSLWIAEIKSHPLFKKFPSKTSNLLPVFINKTEEGLEQGTRALDFLNKERRILFNLGCTARFEDLIKGVIVIFDGFIPTFLSQNEKIDKLFGTYEIYERIPKTIRVYVATILDLYLLHTQPDIENFEDFLIWRTNYRGKFPIVSYDETEYWAFFNDIFTKDHATKETFPKLVEKGITVNYISARFNRKDYLEKLQNRL